MEVSHMFVLGPISLVDQQILVVFGTVFLTSLILAAYAIKQAFSQCDQLEHDRDELSDR